MPPQVQKGVQTGRTQYVRGRNLASVRRTVSLRRPRSGNQIWYTTWPMVSTLPTALATGCATSFRTAVATNQSGTEPDARTASINVRNVFRLCMDQRTAHQMGRLPIILPGVSKARGRARARGIESRLRCTYRWRSNIVLPSDRQYFLPS